MLSTAASGIRDVRAFAGAAREGSNHSFATVGDFHPSSFGMKTVYRRLKFLSIERFHKTSVLGYKLCLPGCLGFR
jgi:hypothetical protein